MSTNQPSPSSLYQDPGQPWLLDPPLQGPREATLSGAWTLARTYRLVAGTRARASEGRLERQKLLGTGSGAAAPAPPGNLLETHVLSSTPDLPVLKPSLCLKSLPGDSGSSFGTSGVRHVWGVVGAFVSPLLLLVPSFP